MPYKKERKENNEEKKQIFKGLVFLCGTGD